MFTFQHVGHHAHINAGSETQPDLSAPLFFDSRILLAIIYEFTCFSCPLANTSNFLFCILWKKSQLLSFPEQKKLEIYKMPKQKKKPK